MLRPCCCSADGAIPPLIWSLLCECADGVSFPSTRTSWEGSPLSTLLMEKHKYYFPSSIGFLKTSPQNPHFRHYSLKSTTSISHPVSVFENIPIESPLSTLLMEKHNYYFPSSIGFEKQLAHRFSILNITHGKAHLLFPVQYRFLKTSP